ncbi:hypothetical protein E4P40_07690 [Blastococcus sp. CT_GayMR20]|nr:hypothetical protein E4P40_07690 [Blastococcus sp. CT_GayMR20]
MGVRGGRLAYLAAYDVHAARVIGRTAPTTGIEPFGQLIEQAMTTEPCASAARVLRTTMDNYSHGMPALAREAADRMGALLLGTGAQTATTDDSGRGPVSRLTCGFWTATNVYTQPRTH